MAETKTPKEIAAGLSALAGAQLAEVAGFWPDAKATHTIDGRVRLPLARRGLVEHVRIPVLGMVGFHAYTVATDLGRQVAAEVQSS